MERRRHARIAQKPVSGIPVAFSGEAKGTGTLYDLSLGGCKVGCTNPPPLGASLTLQLDVPDNADPVKIHAGVVGWTNKGIHFGVTFVRVEATEQLVFSSIYPAFVNLVSGIQDASQKDMTMGASQPGKKLGACVPVILGPRLGRERET
jgi:hypothetical protein